MVIPFLWPYDKRDLMENLLGATVKKASSPLIPVLLISLASTISYICE